MRLAQPQGLLHCGHRRIDVAHPVATDREAEPQPRDVRAAQRAIRRHAHVRVVRRLLGKTVEPPGSEQRKTVVDMILVKRLGTPEDIARAVDFLLADDAGFITGQALFVCGGTSVTGTGGQ